MGVFLDSPLGPTLTSARRLPRRRKTADGKLDLFARPWSFHVEFSSTLGVASPSVGHLAGHFIMRRLYTGGVEVNLRPGANNPAAARFPGECQRIVFGVAGRCSDVHPVPSMNRTWACRAAHRLRAGNHKDLGNATHTAAATIIHTYVDRVWARDRASGVPADLGTGALDRAYRRRPGIG